MSELTVPPEAPESLEHVTTGIPKRRDLVLNRPGNINYAGERGSFPGCRMIMFNSQNVYGLEPADQEKFDAQLAESGAIKAEDAVGLMNLYFKHRGNLLVVEMSVDGSGDIHVLYTNQLEGEELEAFHEVANRTTQWMEEWREKRAHQKELEEEGARKHAAEQAELVELGRKEKAGNFIERARKAEAELEKVSKENLRMRRKLEGKK